jgi:opacity protein-like surface antigen
MKTIAIAAALSVFVAAPALAARSSTYHDPYDSYDARDSGRSARPTKMYIGVSGGQASTDILNLTNTSTAYSVFAGYAFNDYFATELAYANFGNLDLGTTGVNILNSSAGTLTLVASLPMGRYASLFVKGGYSSTTTKVTNSGVEAPSDNLATGTYGGGIQFNVGSRVGIRLGYDVYRMLTGTTYYNTNVGSLGLMFKF